MKPGANSKHPAAGAILWAASSLAHPRDLGLHVSATHLFDLEQNLTGDAIVLAWQVVDASIMPRVCSSPPNITVMMMAWHLSRQTFGVR